MCGENRHKQEPPRLSWRQQQCGKQDGIGRPDHRKRRARKPEREAELRAKVIGERDQEHSKLGASGCYCVERLAEGLGGIAPGATIYPHTPPFLPSPTSAG